MGTLNGENAVVMTFKQNVHIVTAVSPRRTEGGVWV